MRGLIQWAVMIGMAVGLSGARMAEAQASYTATQDLSLSAFGGATGNWTRIEGGRNAGITAGVDLALPTYHRYRPVLEGRGTYPIADGAIDAQKEFLAGLRVERQFGRWHPYGDFMVGRGKINYQNDGLTYGPLTYISSVSAIYSFGGGVDADLTSHFAVRGDVQVQRWDTPFPASLTTATATATGARPAVIVAAAGSLSPTVYPTMVTLGVVYRFNFNPRHHRRP